MSCAPSIQSFSVRSSSSSWIAVSTSFITRVAAAKDLLVSAPMQSILSIGMDTGFRSQSSFYAAFKEITGQSPGDYRKARVT